MFPPGIVVRANPRGWMNENLIIEWIREVWSEQSYYSPNPNSFLLLMDSAICHLTDMVKEELKSRSKIAVIPGGLTKFLQPLDRTVNKIFKNNLRSQWKEWMANEENATYTKSGKRMSVSYKEIAEIVKKASDDVPKNVVIKGFSKALDFDLSEMCDSDDVSWETETDNEDARSSDSKDASDASDAKSDDHPFLLFSPLLLLLVVILSRVIAPLLCSSHMC